MRQKDYVLAALLGFTALSFLGCGLFHGEDSSRQKEKAEAVQAQEGMVYIPPGDVKVRVFERRHEHGAWLPDVEIEEVSDGFFIDKYEFPNVPGELPLSDVSFIEAQTKCRSLGKRLCTLREWLKACQGPEVPDYCYGNEYRRDCCNEFKAEEGSDQAQPVLERSGSRECCRSGYGVYDMTGNLWEWTSQRTVTRYSGYWFWRRRVQLGGCYGIKGENFASYVTNGNSVDFSCGTFGFRCCMDAD